MTIPAVISSSGCSTKARRCIRGCGTTRRGWKRGVEQRHGIDEWRLVGVPERLGAIQRGSLYEDGLRDAREVLERLCNLLHRPAEVRADCHVGKRHAG